MKQKQSLEELKGSSAHKPTVKKVTSMLRSSAMCIMAAVTIGVVSLIGTIAVSSADNSKNKAESVKEMAADEAINWKKASLDEYELVDKAVKIATTTTTKNVTEKTENKTTTKKTAAKKTASVVSMGSKIMYAKEPVNMRKNPNLDADLISTISGDEKVTVDGKTNDGWYRVTYGNNKGFCKSEYFTEKAPVKQTAAKKSAAKYADAEPVISKNSSTVSCSDEEFEMLCYVLQNEVGNLSEGSKIAVANVILNRVKSPNFPNSIVGVLTSNNQFTAITNYYNRSNPPTQNTIDCARRALNGEDNSNGAIFYYAPKYCGGSTAAWFESLSFCMEFEGQRFFKY